MKTQANKSITRSVLMVLLVIFNFSIADGNVPLHEWTVSTEESNSTINEKGETEHTTPENLITWIFEDGTFIPMAKLQGYKSYSIITDHLGTPVESYDEEGTKVWSRELNIYGETRKEFGDENFIPFLYQGQYLDTETELAYNRFRYYDSSAGVYISQDPIKLDGGLNVYGYVKDSNLWVDIFGLSKACVKAGDGVTHDIVLTLKKSDYPETGKHIQDAIKGGHPDIVTIMRGTAKSNRKKSLKGIPTKKGLDRDEYPMAMFSEGGSGASVRYIDPSDNRGAGSAVGNALSSFDDGTRVKIVIVD